MIESPRAVRIFVTDLDLAKAWYCQALEMDPSCSDENSVTFFVDACLLTLSLGPGAGTAGAHVYWAVDDLAGEFQRLRAIGHETAHAVQALDSAPTTLQVLDPFGNVFGLIAVDRKSERKARSQRVAEKVALQNVRGTLDQLQQKDAEQRKLNRIIGWCAGFAVLVVVLMLWHLLGSRPPAQPVAVKPVIPAR